MPWRLSDAQVLELRPFVKDQRILDLGAADLEGSRLMLELGARDVLAVDRHEMRPPRTDKIETRVAYFHDVKETRPVVLASWIMNWPVNIEHHLHAAELIISISKNTDRSACGYRQMWELLRQRELLLHVPEHRNTLTVYGPKTQGRLPTGEELAALWPNPMRQFSFEEAEELASRNQ